MSTRIKPARRPITTDTANSTGSAHLQRGTQPAARLISEPTLSALRHCASAAELSLAAAGIHRLIDVLDARRSQSQPDILLRQITEYVQTHLCGKIRLEDIAQEVYMSPSYVSRFFKQATGMNLSGYIRAQKIEKAKQLLRLYPVGEVSAQLGYTSVSHFVSIFSEETGLTPYRFKRQSQPDGQEMP